MYKVSPGVILLYNNVNRRPDAEKIIAAEMAAFETIKFPFERLLRGTMVRLV